MRLHVGTIAAHLRKGGATDYALRRYLQVGGKRQVKAYFTPSVQEHLAGPTGRDAPQNSIVWHDVGQHIVDRSGWNNPERHDELEVLLQALYTPTIQTTPKRSTTCRQPCRSGSSPCSTTCRPKGCRTRSFSGRSKWCLTWCFHPAGARLCMVARARTAWWRPHPFDGSRGGSSNSPCGRRCARRGPLRVGVRRWPPPACAGEAVRLSCGAGRSVVPR